MSAFSGGRTRTRLGGDGPPISRLGLGCMTMSHPGRGDDQSLRLIASALDAGVTFLDTADKYGGGHNERLVGRAVRGRRHEVVVATASTPTSPSRSRWGP
jgi:aryl-alcohol dehydrogenase-like predicted oxidoreductase